MPADVYTEPHEGLAAGDEVSVQFGFRGGAYAYHDGLGHVDVEVVGTHGRMLFHEARPASRGPSAPPRLGALSGGGQRAPGPGWPPVPGGPWTAWMSGS